MHQVQMSTDERRALQNTGAPFWEEIKDVAGTPLQQQLPYLASIEAHSLLFCLTEHSAFVQKIGVDFARLILIALEKNQLCQWT